MNRHDIQNIHDSTKEEIYESAYKNRSVGNLPDTVAELMPKNKGNWTTEWNTDGPVGEHKGGYIINGFRCAPFESVDLPDYWIPYYIGMDINARYNIIIFRWIPKVWSPLS